MNANKEAAGVEGLQNNPDDLFERAQAYGVQYKNGSWGWSSNIWNRSAANTDVIDSEHELQPEHRYLMLRVLEHMKCRPMIQADANLGSPGSPVEMRCRLYCDPQFPDIAYRWQQLNFPGDPTATPDAQVFFIPHFLENPSMPGKPNNMLRVLRFPFHNYTIVVGSSYQGEVKKGFLSHWIYHCFQKGGTGEHASLREFTLDRVDETKKRIVMGVWDPRPVHLQPLDHRALLQGEVRAGPRLVRHRAGHQERRHHELVRGPRLQSRAGRLDQDRGHQRAAGRHLARRPQPPRPA